LRENSFNKDIEGIATSISFWLAVYGLEVLKDIRD
jgi:hypothetical protein